MTGPVKSNESSSGAQLAGITTDLASMSINDPDFRPLKAIMTDQDPRLTPEERNLRFTCAIGDIFSQQAWAEANQSTINVSQPSDLLPVSFSVLPMRPNTLVNKKDQLPIFNDFSLVKKKHLSLIALKFMPVPELAQLVAEYAIGDEWQSAEKLKDEAGSLLTEVTYEALARQLFKNQVAAECGAGSHQFVLPPLKILEKNIVVLVPAGRTIQLALSSTDRQASFLFLARSNKESPVCVRSRQIRACKWNYGYAIVDPKKPFSPLSYDRGRNARPFKWIIKRPSQQDQRPALLTIALFELCQDQLDLKSGQAVDGSTFSSTLFNTGTLIHLRFEEVHTPRTGTDSEIRSYLEELKARVQNGVWLPNKVITPVIPPNPMITKRPAIRSLTRS